MIEFFNKYQKAGFKTLPTNKDKTPNVNGTWKGGVDDRKAYDGSFGIGIICGKLSLGLECLDFDNHFGDAKEIISEYLRIDKVREIYTKYKLPVESTTSGGFHLLYRCDHNEGNKKLAQKPKRNEMGNWVPDTIIETRGEGGYFVAAPTPGYKVQRNDICDIQTITKEEREILIENAKTFNTWHEIKKHEQESQDRPGDIYNLKSEAIDDMKSSLRHSGWEEVRSGIWRRPGKKNGISATLGKVAENVFYNFSSNAHPFSDMSAYTPFQVVTLLDYNGDFAAFAKEISDRYELNKPIQQRSEQKKIEKKEKTKSEYDSILSKAYIDLNIPVEKPPIIMKIRDYSGVNYFDRRLFTLGNFSAITGKSKSKKTFLSSLLLAAASKNGVLQNKFIGDLPNNKRHVFFFDTEQSRYDSYVTSMRVPDLSGIPLPDYASFDLREYDPLERCDIIGYALDKFKDSIGYVVIDGIADLAKAINDEEEASRVVSLLMKWTKNYNCHITTIIHQNKDNDYATGHIGSSVIKKAEAVISVKKNEDNSMLSEVKCDLIRGTMDFSDFTIEIDENGMPKAHRERVMDNSF